MTENIWILKPWLTDTPEEWYITVNNLIQQYKPKTMCDFSKGTSIDFVYESNKLENTLPKGTHKEMQQILEDIYDNPPGPEQYITWDAEGDPKTSPQLIQHMQALTYIINLKDEILTTDIIKTLHLILMKNSTNSDGTFTLSGEYRKTACHNGAGTTYPPSSCNFELHLQYILNNWNNNKTDNWIVDASKLYSDILKLHPFENGNGRTSRLLLAYIGIKNGLRFPLILSSGHSKSKEHCRKAIISSYYDNCKELNTLILCSVYKQLFNYKVNVEFI